MIEKRILALILIFCLTSLLDCQPYYMENLNNTTSESAITDNISSQPYPTVELNENQIINEEPNESSQTDIEKLTDDVTDYLANQEQITFLPTNEDNSYYSAQTFTSSEKGFYFLKGTYSEHIWFYDSESGKASILCSRAECSHGEDCDAYRDCEEYCMTAIFYYGHRLYMIGKDDEGGYLDSWNEDGSKYKRIVKLWDKNVFCDEAEGLLKKTEIIHNGYMYYLVYNAPKAETELYRVAIDGSANCEKLAHFETNKLELLSLDLYANGEYIYIVNSRLNNGAQILEYDIQSDSIKVIYEGIDWRILGLCFIDNYLYFFENETGLLRMDTATYEYDIIMDAPYGGKFQLSYDGNYLFVNNSVSVKTIRIKTEYGRIDESIPIDLQYMVYVITKDGKLIDELVFHGDVERILFGDNRYLIALQADYDNVLVENNMAGGLVSGKYVTIYDKRLIGSGFNFWRAVTGWDCMIVNSF